MGTFCLYLWKEVEIYFVVKVKRLANVYGDIYASTQGFFF